MFSSRDGIFVLRCRANLQKWLGLLAGVLVGRTFLNTPSVFVDSRKNNLLSLYGCRTREEELRWNAMNSNATANLPSNLTISTTENTSLNLTSATARALITISTMGSTLSSSTQNASSTTELATESTLSSSIQNVSSTTESLLTSTLQSILSTAESLLPSTTPILSSATESLLENNTKNISTMASLLPSTTESLFLNTTHVLASTTTESVLASTVPVFLPDTAEKLVSSLTLNETFNSSAVMDLGAEANYLDVNIALIIYGCILLGCVVTAVSKCLFFYKICMNASKSIHNEMFSCVLRAPMRFFDKQTSGKTIDFYLCLIEFI